MIQTNSRTQAAYGCKKPKIEVADILREHISDYLSKYRMPPEHYKVVYDILNCRTAYLGGHMEACDNCGGLPGRPLNYKFLLLTATNVIILGASRKFLRGGIKHRPF